MVIPVWNVRFLLHAHGVSASVHAEGDQVHISDPRSGPHPVPKETLDQILSIKTGTHWDLGWADHIYIIYLKNLQQLTRVPDWARSFHRVVYEFRVRHSIEAEVGYYTIDEVPVAYIVGLHSKKSRDLAIRHVRIPSCRIVENRYREGVCFTSNDVKRVMGKRSHD